MLTDEKMQKNKKPNPKKRNNAKLSETDRILNTVEEENKPLEKKKKIKREKENNDDVSNAVQIKIQDNSVKAAKEKKRNKSKKKVRSEEQNSALIDEFGEHCAEDGDEADTSNENLVGDASEVEKEIENSGPGGNVGKSKKAKKKKKKDHCSLKKHEELEEKCKEVDEDDVYLISSGDEDCSKGMNKWITEYHQSRPGLKVLQQRIDDFITAHEAKLEQERKEREARAADGGWTVVVHHKGRKKTTDSESGIAVGSVAQAAVEDKMAKKKKNEVGLDFYRFQRREAKRNEIMMLQSKFEQDRKRIQQLRAARKFKPY